MHEVSFGITILFSVLLGLMILTLALEEKIHAKILVAKKKPRKQNRFQRKMAEMMEQAEQQRKPGKR